MNTTQTDKKQETAKEILDRHIASTDSFIDACLKTAEEIADKAWEAGKGWQFDEDHYLFNESKTHRDKSTFMKDLFPEDKL